MSFAIFGDTRLKGLRSPISVSVVKFYFSNKLSNVLSCSITSLIYPCGVSRVHVLGNKKILNRPTSCGVVYCLRSSNYMFKSIQILCRSVTYLNIRTSLGFSSKRFMHRSKQIASLNTFHLLDRLIDPLLLNQITAKDPSAFLNTVYDHCFDPNEGAIQHKYTLLHSIFRQKYDSSVYGKYYAERFPDTKVNFVPNIPVDFRVFGELPVVRHYENNFRENIKNIVLTGDSIVTTFEKQRQTNPDMLVNINSSYGTKGTFQDVKSGIIKHSTAGSIGLCTYDINGRLVPVTSREISLFDVGKKNLAHIGFGLKQDNIFHEPFQRALKQGNHILDTEPCEFKANSDVQNLLWREIQSHPMYKRSVAFTFTEFQTQTPIMDKYTIYQNKFTSMLSDRNYSTSSISDRREIYKAMLIAYREIDPEISRKINYFVNTSGIQIDNQFLHVLGGLIRDTLI